jgi:hypothetical protein
MTLSAVPSHRSMVEHMATPNIVSAAAGYKPQGYVGVYCPRHLVVVPGAEIAGHHHPGAQRRPGKEAHQKEDERSGRGHAGQRLLAQKPADYKRVGGVIQLLKELAEHQGRGKLCDDLPAAAHGHVFCAGLLRHKRKYPRRFYQCLKYIRPPP